MSNKLLPTIGTTLLVFAFLLASGAELVCAVVSMNNGRMIGPSIPALVYQPSSKPRGPVRISLSELMTYLAPKEKAEPVDFRSLLRMAPKQALPEPEPPAKEQPQPQSQPEKLPESPKVPPKQPEAPKPYVTVLMYHHLAPQPDPKYYGTTIDPEKFAVQMAYLRENDYYTPSLAELVDFLQGKTTLPPKSVMITFDDGYESNYIYAYPILKQYNLRAVIFPIGGGIRHKGIVRPGIPKLSDIQMQEMYASGLVEFGSHTFAMHDYHQGQPLLRIASTSEILADLQQVEEVFAAIGLPPAIALAYPFGQYGPEAQQACEEMGYQLAFTTRSGRTYSDTNPLQIPRKTVSGGLSVQQFADLVR
ncbi:MAG: polysaccharide deacetylase family protein [Firmicutes bacterium]|nr:polysaccharide deacetylase family protein [Bacillota bacterium]